MTAKINTYVDRFLYVVSSSTPLTRQRDLDERSYSILSFGLERPQPDAFFLPAAYLCHTRFFEDVRMYDNGAIWNNDSWRPSTRTRSSIEIFNFQAACHATNASQPFRPTELDNRPDPRAKAQDDVLILSGP